MKKAFFLISAMIIMMAASAQTDFTGSWKLNNSKSKLGDQFSMAPKEVIISQSGNDMTIEKHSEFQGQEFTSKDKLTLDGKECVNDGMMDTKKKSTAVWDDAKKTLKIISKIPMQDGGEFAITEVYKLDGGNFVCEMSATSSFGDMAETQVYDKK
jgi:hypothetical protein